MILPIELSTWLIDVLKNGSCLLGLSQTETSIIPAIISTVIFLLVFLAISFQLLNETAAALLGAVAIFLISYMGGQLNSNLQILSFEEAMKFVDWNVIFLILGMMIFMAILAETNIFRFLSFRLFNWTRGRIWLLVAALVVLTGVTSSFLNNVTAILLIVPLSIQIAIALGLHPFTLVIPEIMASNIGGAMTIIGDPPSTIVGSHIGLGFGEYFVNLAPLVIICILLLLLVTGILYRKELRTIRESISPKLLERMETEAMIKNPSILQKAVVVGCITLVLFFVADKFGNMPPSVVALTGAAVLILWVRPNMDDMLREVDWTTLIFFIGLFIVVGALENSGVLQWIAEHIRSLAGDSMTTAVLLTEWFSGITSGIVANIPFTVAALPIADMLTENITSATGTNTIYYALIVGADFGGNLTYIGSAANIVAVGLLALAGYRMSFQRFLRDGIPVTLITLLAGSIYLLLRY